MPYHLAAQRAYFNAHKKELEAKGVNIDEWNASSKGLKLPEHTKKKTRTGMSKGIGIVNKK